MIPELEYREVDLDDLRPDPNNPRRIASKAMDALAASVSRFGLVQPIVVNRVTGHVVGGHQRLAALRQLHHKRAMVVYGSWSHAEERALNVTLNNPAVQGEFTDPAAYLDEVLEGFSFRDFRALRLDDVFPSTNAGQDKDTAGQGLIYKLVVTCDDETHQADLLERLEAEGLAVAPLIA